MPVKVLKGNHKFLYNMMLKLFAEQLKLAVNGEIAQKVETSLPLLRDKIGSVIMGLSPELQQTLGGAEAVIGTLKKASGALAAGAVLPREEADLHAWGLRNDAVVAVSVADAGPPPRRQSQSEK